MMLAFHNIHPTQKIHMKNKVTYTITYFTKNNVVYNLTELTKSS